MTAKLRGFFVGLLTLLALAFALPVHAQPAAPLCGFVWVNTNYVLPENCAEACKRQGHTAAQCAKLVPLCRSCWLQMQACAKSRAIPPANRCKVCTDRYAACMKPFFR